MSPAPWPFNPPANSNDSPLAASVPQYPLDFAIPDRQPYQVAVDMGVVRSAMSAGNARQRRLYRMMPHQISLSFHMHIEDLYLWQNWVNQYAYSWFLCPVSTMYAGGPPLPSNIRGEVLRFASDLAISMEGFNWVAVTVAAEMSIDAQVRNPPVGTGPWIIGGTPAAPNSATWYIGGTPAAPSPDWAIGGTPEFPNSLV